MCLFIVKKIPGGSSLQAMKTQHHATANANANMIPPATDIVKRRRSSFAEPAVLAGRRAADDVSDTPFSPQFSFTPVASLGFGRQPTRLARVWPSIIGLPPSAGAPGSALAPKHPPRQSVPGSRSYRRPTAARNCRVEARPGNPGGIEYRAVRGSSRSAPGSFGFHKVASSW